MRHYWLMYQIYSTVKNMFENGMIPKLIQKRPITVWNKGNNKITKTPSNVTKGKSKLISI